MRAAIHTSKLQFFSEVGTQRFKFFNQLIFISIRKSLSIFAKQIFVLFFFFNFVAVILALDVAQSRQRMVYFDTL
jgi:hypothetical protein